MLKTVKTNNPGDADQCTAEMLQLWRERQPGGSWNQLIQALKTPNIKLEALASKIEGMLCEGKCVIWLYNSYFGQLKSILIGQISINFSETSINSL